MREIAVMMLVITTPFALAAAALWLRERRKGRDPAPELAFLVSDLGFARPESYFVSRELHHTFKRGVDEVDVFWDGGAMDVTIRMQGRATTVSHLSLQAIADLIRGHPEILRGHFEALVATDDAVRGSGLGSRARD